MSVPQNHDSEEMNELADDQDDWHGYLKFDYFGAAYCCIRDKTGQLEAACLNVLIPQIDYQTCHLYYMMHWQVVVQAFRNFFYGADVFRGFFIFWKFVYFFFENV